MTRSSLTEETPATPGWVEGRLATVFAAFPAAVRDSYADCLAGVRGAVDVDGGHDGCRRQALTAVGGRPGDALDLALQALEAEISRDT